MTDWVKEAERRLSEAYHRRHVRNATRYDWVGGYLFEAQERERTVLRHLERNGLLPLRGRKILDVGCGTGRWLRDLIRWGAEPEDMTGIELRPEAAEKARRLMGSLVPIHCGSASALPFASESFDLVAQGTVLSSVLEEGLRARIASETMRVLKPGGALLWYDFCFNNPSNRDVRAVTMEDLKKLFAGCRFDLERAVPAPPLLRMIAPVSYMASYMLACMPWFCTFYAGLIIKPTSQGTREQPQTGAGLRGPDVPRFTSVPNQARPIHGNRARFWP